MRRGKRLLGIRGRLVFERHFYQLPNCLGSIDVSISLTPTVNTSNERLRCDDLKTFSLGGAWIGCCRFCHNVIIHIYPLIFNMCMCMLFSVDRAPLKGAQLSQEI